MKSLLTAAVLTSTILMGSSAFAAGHYSGYHHTKNVAQNVENYYKCIMNNPVKDCVYKAH